MAIRISERKIITAGGGDAESGKGEAKEVCEAACDPVGRRFRAMLPPPLFQQVMQECKRDGEAKTWGERWWHELREIRIREGRRVCLTLFREGRERDVVLDYEMQSTELSEIFGRVCDGSLYAYSESIVRGYVSPGDGIRVGVCGHAVTREGRVVGVYDVSALNIRLPRHALRLEGELEEICKRSCRRGEGVLIYSPPGGGKTTLLRAIALSLAGSVRVALVDSDGELCTESDPRQMMLDVLTGYPRAEGIRIATAYMNPHVIICDEIGRVDEAEAILGAQNCGVPLIATAHGASLEGIMRRECVSLLHRAGAFGTYIELCGQRNGSFEYRITERDGANAALDRYIASYK